MGTKCRVQSDRAGERAGQSSAKASANAAFSAYVAEYKAASPELYDATGASASQRPLKLPNRKRFSLVNNRHISDDQSCITESTFKASNTRSRGGITKSSRRQSKPMRLISNAVKVTRRSITLASNSKVNKSKQGADGSYSITLPDGLIRDVRGSVLATLLDFSLTELGRHMGNGEREDSFSSDSLRCEPDNEIDKSHQCQETSCHQKNLIVCKHEESDLPRNEPTESEGMAVMTAQLANSESAEDLNLPNSKLTIRGVKMVEAKTEFGSTKFVPVHQKDKIISYRSKEGIVEALIVDVHRDDLHEPYYTIRLTDGREKQTDNDHILLIPDIEKPKMEKKPQKSVKKDPPGSVLVPCPSNRSLIHPLKKPTYRQQARKSITQFVKNVIDTSQGRGNNGEQPSDAPVQNRTSNYHDKSNNKTSEKCNTKPRDKSNRKHRDESHHKKSRHCSHDDKYDNSRSRSNNNRNELLQTRRHNSSSRSLSASPEEAEKALAKLQRSNLNVVPNNERHDESGRSTVKNRRKTIKNTFKLWF
ncbi:hypothetical protein ACHAXS_006570 [Conticribra weissflogii]